MIKICEVLTTEDGEKWVKLADYQALLQEYENVAGYKTNKEIVAELGEDEIPD